MRTKLLATVLLASACGSDPAPLPDPPVLTVTSPARSLIQGAAGSVTVTGTVAANPEGVAVATVLVNNVAAMVNVDGTFTAVIQIQPGATLIHTVATDAKGGVATDTRSVEAGDLRPEGSNVTNAVTAALSTQAFAKISAAAGPIIKGLDLKTMLAPLQPMVHSGDEDGPDCLYGQLFIENVTMTNVVLSLVPVAGGLQFSAEIDGLDVPGHMSYAVACLGGTDTTDIKASKVVVTGTLLVAPNGMSGFTTTLDSPDVQLTGLDISSSGVPGAILDIIPLDSAIEYIMPKVAGMFMTPMMNTALGALGGPQKLNVLGKTIDVQVSPTAITFSPTGGLVTLDMSMLIEGSESGKGFIQTDNGMPTMDPGQGLQLGLAGNLANEMLSEVNALGMINLTLPETGGTFDSVNVTTSSPPMISATSADGKMVLVLPDMIQTFIYMGQPVAKAAINATVELQVAPSNNGYGVALQLGTPDINVDVLPDIANETRFSSADLSDAVKLCLDSQIASISALLGSIPLPAMAGLQMTNLSVDSDDGYVMMKGTLQ